MVKMNKNKMRKNIERFAKMNEWTPGVHHFLCGSLWKINASYFIPSTKNPPDRPKICRRINIIYICVTIQSLYKKIISNNLVFSKCV